MTKLTPCAQALYTAGLQHEGGSRWSAGPVPCWGDPAVTYRVPQLSGTTVKALADCFLLRAGGEFHTGWEFFLLKF